MSKSKSITKIVLTGGPCAGKTTGISWVVDNFTKLGYKVLVVAETATELINGNAKPWEISGVDFQVTLYNMTKAKEKSYEDFAEKSDFDKILIVCDRGSLDGESYLSDKDKPIWHERLNLSSVEMMSDYDAVFHLVTAAKGASEYYTKANNSARIESVEEAIVSDERTLNSWTGHSHLRIIDNSTDFENKMQRLVSEIASFLGEPEPFEVERKFLIKMPDLENLNKLGNVQKVEILQTYLKNNENGEEVRVRQRGDGETFMFTKTTKRSLSGLKRVELERKITAEQYLKELMNADINLHQIRKTRYCISYKHTYLELDVYPFWKDKAILEVELINENDDFQIPDWIEIIKEVTDNDLYKNHSLAKYLGKRNYKIRV